MDLDFARHHLHHTWARTFYCRPELYIQPESIEQLQRVMACARTCRRRITVTGSGHSPSDLTMTSSILVNLDNLAQILEVNSSTGIVVVQAGIRLHSLGVHLKKKGLAMPNLGSIDEQSIAGAIGTATHGSSLRHGIISESVLALKILLADGTIRRCTKDEDGELFRAALVSLGALGIIVETTIAAVPAFNIEWTQSLQPLQNVLAEWENALWTQSEFVRLWWTPYTQQCILWKADKTKKPLRKPSTNIWHGRVGFVTYYMLLYMAHWIPRMTPWLEKFLIRVQYGLSTSNINTAVQEGRIGLLMNCLYSQTVNEWAVPLKKGPEALRRLSAWLNGDETSSRIPFSSKGIWVHAPIEVRVSDSSINSSPRPFLDSSVPDGPTLYINATLYRPFGVEPECRARYYAGFEWLMKELGGRPHVSRILWLHFCLSAYTSR